MKADKVPAVIAISALAAIFVPSISANVAEADNALYFHQLCALVSASKIAGDIPTAAQDPATAITELHELNFTTSPKEWRDKFKNAAATFDKEKVAAYFSLKPTDVNSNWQEAWQHWVAAFKQTGDPKTTPQHIKDAAHDSLAPHQKQAMHIETAKALALALNLQKQRLTVLSKANALTTQQIKDRLLKAAYGEKATEPVFETAKAFTGYDQTRQTTCADDKATSAAATLACLCIQDNGDAPPRPCGRNMPNTNKWNSASQQNLDTAAGDLLKACPSAEKKPITSNWLGQITTQVRNSIRIINNNGYLGETENGSCTGTAATGVCVKLNGYTNDPTTHKGKLKWLDDLESLTEQLRENEQATAQAALLANQIVAIRDTTYGLAATLRALTAPQPISVTAAQTTPQHPSAASLKTECEAHHASQADCDAKNFCTYDSKEKSDKKCKYNSTKAKEKGVSVTQTQTGVGTETTTEICKGKPEKECKSSDCKLEGR
uniref:Variant surface glycoprotein n=1 Tax=Trypanosoma brucei TaxID=5691 RepID=A0A1V0FXW6_9TRYP|nr:variant surface glycoprotein [Trypanosoma brucei]